MSRVLIIEDDAWLADCMSTWLEADGHMVQWAADAQAGLDALDRAVPDVIVLDMFLPVVNGLQVLHQLPSYADVANVPIIICSSALPETLPDVSAYGVKTVLDKTRLTPSIFRTTLKQVVAHAAI